MSEIHRISNTADGGRDGDIVFIHGLDGDARATWHPTDHPDAYWPDWVAATHPSLAVWSLDYEANSMRWTGNAMPLDERATATLALLDAHEIGNRPVVFIAHSLGGLLVKRMLHNAWESVNPTWQRLAEQTRGVIFLATPHEGSAVADWITHIKTLTRATIAVEDLRAHAPSLRRLNTWYRDKSSELSISTEVYYEKIPTRGVLVVNESSANPGISGVEPIPLDEDHLTICKPASRDHLVCLRTDRFIRDCIAAPSSSKLRDPDEASEGGSEETVEFARQITERMGELNRVVERLTEDQIGIIRRLRGLNQARIAGCAGSGKTLVAAEKARRLSDAGLSTLFLCHNPLLADHVSSLCDGSGVVVLPFGEWVYELSGGSAAADTSWTSFHEPSDDDLLAAVASLDGTAKYDAVVVDEGQDFRGEWWEVVRSALAAPDSGILYIFHDDSQTLLAARATYPVPDQSLDLSRNCRNAGKVFELVRKVHPNAPSCDSDLAPLGASLIDVFSREALRDSIENALAFCRREAGERSPVILRTSVSPFEGSVFSKMRFDVSDRCDWQSELRRVLKWITRTPSRGTTLRGSAESVLGLIDELSSEAYPNDKDKSVVDEICGRFAIAADAKREGIERLRKNSLRWTVKDGRARLWRRKKNKDGLWRSEALMFLGSKEWLDGLPPPHFLRCREGNSLSSGETVAVHHVGDYKGLEADAVIVVAEGPERLSRTMAYVGISRARMAIAMLVSDSIIESLPYQLRECVEGAARLKASGR